MANSGPAGPASGIHASLLRHLHLVVNKPVPLPPSPSPDQILDQLLSVQSAVSHSNTVTWKYFAEPPRDGLNMLVWSAPQLKNSFPSDGYLYLDPETVQQYDIKGHKLEMYTQRAGFRPGQEPFAKHARRRYRLFNNPQFWLVIYRPANPQDQAPAANFQLTTPVRQVLQERDMLSRSQAQLMRKEFMLYDAQSFPTIMPPNVNPAAQPPQNTEYPGNVMAHMNKSQQGPFPQRQQQGPPQQQRPGADGDAAYGGFPSKRARRGSNLRDASATAVPGPFRGARKPPGSGEDDWEIPVDYMDSLTPRELALSRYIQHHEWLEEVISSPYDTHRIIPPRLGLGRKGEIESLTQDFFDAPLEIEYGSTLKDASWVTSKAQAMEGKPVVEEVDPSTRIDYQRVGKLDATKADDFRKMAAARLDQMNAEMAQMKKDFAEQMTRLQEPSDLTKAEQTLRQSTLSLINGETDPSDPSVNLDERIRALESTYGKTVKTVPVLECLDVGGREEARNEPTPPLEVNGADNVDDPMGMSQDDEQVPTKTDAHEAQPPTEDVNQMSTENMQADESTSGPVAGESADESFVIVNKDDAQPPVTAEESKTTDAMDFTSLEAGDSNLGAADLGDFDTNADVNFDTADFGEGIDFGDMDTAGDELSGYAQEIANMGGAKREDLGPDSPTIQGHTGGQPPQNGPA